jgi:hypothetical protein
MICPRDILMPPSVITFDIFAQKCRLSRDQKRTRVDIDEGDLPRGYAYTRLVGLRRSLARP